MSPKQTKYFIGFLIEGDAAAWHTELAKTISEKFNTWELHKKVPPHITIFQSFETVDINPVKNLLREWAQSRSISGDLTVLGFDHFEDRVVFAGVDTDPSSKQLVEELREALRKIPTMPTEDFPIWHPHATLANHVSAQEINQIWDFVLTLEKPNYVLPFNNVTLFRFEGDQKWVIEESFRFSTSG